MVELLTRFGQWGIEKKGKEKEKIGKNLKKEKGKRTQKKYMYEEEEKQEKNKKRPQNTQFCAN